MISKSFGSQIYIHLSNRINDLLGKYIFHVGPNLLYVSNACLFLSGCLSLSIQYKTLPINGRGIGPGIGSKK